MSNKHPKTIGREKMGVVRNAYGRELRIGWGNTLYLINLQGAIGEETTNEDLWNNGWRIGFTRISRYLKPFGIYLFLATRED